MSHFRPAGDSDFDSEEEDDYFDLNDRSPNILVREGHHLDDTSYSDSESMPVDHYETTSVLLDGDPLVIHDLETAISVGNVEAVKQLLDSVATPDVVLKSGLPLIVHAAYLFQHHTVKLLIDHGAEINKTSSNGDTALHVACKSSTEPDCEDALKTVMTLVSAGADIDAKDYNKRTPLMYACRRNQASIVKYLLQSNSSQRILAKDDREWTSIDWAAVYGNTDTLGILISSLQEKLDYRTFQSFKMWPQQVLMYLKAEGFMALDEKLDDKLAVNLDSPNENDLQNLEDGEEQYVSAPQSASSLYSDASAKNKESKCNLSTPIMSTDSVDDSSDSGSTDCVMSKDSENMLSANNEQISNSCTVELETTTCLESFSDLDEIEKNIFPTVIKRYAEKPEQYQTFGQLELFLAGLELTHLIPLFQKQDIKFEELLCLTSDELEQIGIKAFGTRKRIAAAIEECHEKHTSSSLLPDRTKTPLTTDKLFRMMAGSAEQILYISSCIRYIKYHIDCYPDTLYPEDNVDYDQAPLQTYKDKIDDIRQSLANLAFSLRVLKSHSEKLEKEIPASVIQPVGMATPLCCENGKRCPMKLKVVLGISIAIFGGLLLERIFERR